MGLLHRVGQSKGTMSMLDQIRFDVCDEVIPCLVDVDGG